MLKKNPNPLEAKPGDDEPAMPLISIEDVGPLAGAVMCLLMLAAITYYVFFQPSPFQKIYDQLDRNEKKAEQVVKPKVPAMMPAQAIIVPQPDATEAGKTAPAQKTGTNATGKP